MTAAVRTLNVVWVVASLLVAGCGNKKKATTEESAGSAMTSAGSGSANLIKGDEPPKATAITPQRLAPQITDLGDAGALPDRIVIELEQPIVGRYEVGSPSPETVLDIKPETAGRVTATGVAELTFTPAESFAFDTQYTVELKQIGTPDGGVKAPAGSTWTHSFKTPKFAVIGWNPVSIDLATHAVTMKIAFSGAVLPNIAMANMKFAIDGVVQSSFSMLPTYDDNSIAVTLKDKALVAGTKLTVAIAANLPAYHGPTLGRGTELTYTVTDDKLVFLQNATLKEGANGFYVDVQCNDDATPRPKPKAAPAAGSDASGVDADGDGEPDSNPERDYDYSYNSAPLRCQLDSDAVAKIEFVPPVKQAYVTSGTHGFRIFGDFPHGGVRMTIRAGAKSLDGGVVQAPFEKSFAVSARNPQLAFGASGRYLPRSAWTSLAVKHLNVDAVNLIVRHIPAENLIYWLGEEDGEAADDRTSDVVLKKTIPLHGSFNTPTTTYLDLGSMVPAQQGVLELSLIGIGTRATSRLLLTNMSLVAKRSVQADDPRAQTVKVWGLDMETSALLEGVEVTMVRKSGKVLAKCTTKGAAGCDLVANVANDPDESEPFALIAKRGDDLTYIRYSDLKADVTESSTAGEPYVAKVAYRAAVYADRGVYRPGDTAHVVAVVRDVKDLAPTQPLPVDVVLVDPLAKVVKKLALATNPGGVVTLDPAFPPFATTGTWRVQFRVGDKSIATYNLQVEEFVPERMEVTTTPKLPDVLIGTPAAFDVKARYLFGGTAEGSPVQVTCTVEPTQFTPEQNADYTYGTVAVGKAVALGTSAGRIDATNAATVACPSGDATTQSTQTSELRAQISVLEAGSGRATVASTTMQLHPEKYYVGLRTKAMRAERGTTMQVEGVVVDWQGKLAPAAITKVNVEFAHLEADYSYGYDYDSGDSRYDRNLRQVPEGKQTVTVTNGKFTFDVTPAEAPQGFVVRATSAKAATELVLDGDNPYDYYGYGDGSYTDMTPRPAKPTKLAITTPAQLEVGQPATVTVKTPYAGKLLWTIETDHVIAAEWRDASGPEQTWQFTLKDYAPNVYVSAFLVKDPHLESKDAFLPDRAFGLESVRVTPTQFTQPLKLTVPTEVRSNAALTVQLDAGPVQGPTFATVAVVDEGILSLTRFPTPDPLKQLLAKRALAVDTYETIGWTMLHRPADVSSKTGGGDEADEAEADVDSGGDLGASRVQPVKPVALWSGVVALDASGKASIPFTLPTYRGKLRVMAFTESATRIGRAEAQVVVKDPVVLQVTMPRFATAGDEIQIPVFVTNVSGSPLDVAVDVSAENLAVPGVVMPAKLAAPLQFIGAHAGSAKLADGAATTLVFTAKVVVPVGGGTLHVKATANGPKGKIEVADAVDLPFLPAGPKERVIQKLQLTAGTHDLKVEAAKALGAWVPTSETTTFWITANPYGEAFDHLKYLVHYPYGCIEQTTSAVRPLLYVADLLEQTDPELGNRSIEDMVLAGIDRILSMETPSGGFGYWPGSTDPEDWGTAYATHFLLDAKQAGYAVPEARLQSVLAWMQGRVTQYERGMPRRDKYRAAYDEQAESYMQYVLAVAGKGRKARIAKLLTQIPAKATAEQLEDQYLLQAALYLAGDRRYEKALKAPDSSPIMNPRVNSWSFYSDRRRRGLMLSTFHDLFGNDPAGEALATRVAESLAQEPSGYYTTQELAWGVSGLGKWVKGLNVKGVAGGTLTANGKDLAPRQAKHKTTDKAWSVRRASEYDKLVLDVPPQTAGMYLVVSSEGVRAGSDYKVGGNGMQISRTYKALDGSPIDVAAGVPLGEVAFVEIEVKNTGGLAIQNVALVDRLPAGFEIENPKLGRDTQLSWFDGSDQWSYDYLNLRDDRLEAFGTIQTGAMRRLVYSIRAVTAGTTTVPPIEVSAMYDPTLWARAKGGTAKVVGPWSTPAPAPAPVP